VWSCAVRVALSFSVQHSPTSARAIVCTRRWNLNLSATLYTRYTQIPEGSDLLKDVGDKFMSVGLCNEAVIGESFSRWVFDQAVVVAAFCVEFGPLSFALVAAGLPSLLLRSVCSFIAAQLILQFLTFLSPMSPSCFS
jgi:hypothetical protein